MMKNRNNNSRIFFTELMFSILFFIVIAAICVQCFAGAYKTSRSARELTQAVNVASNVAEQFLGTNSLGDFTMFLDENWVECNGDGMYKVTGIITEGEPGAFESMSIRVTFSEDDSEIYSLIVKKALKAE